MHLPTVIIRENRPAIRGRLKTLTSRQAVLTCDDCLPRGSFCMLEVGSSSNDIRMRVWCKVRESVHASMIFLIYLQIERFAYDLNSKPLKLSGTLTRQSEPSESP